MTNEERLKCILAQDLENSFKSIYFVKKKYENLAIMISTIKYVSPVVPCESETLNFYEFHIIDEHQKELPMRYKTENEALSERIKLLTQIEDFYLRGF